MVAAPGKQDSFSLTDELYQRLVCNGFESAIEWYSSKTTRCPLFPLFKVDEILKRALNSTENKVAHGNFQITKERRMELAGKLHEYVACLPLPKQNQFEEMLIRTPDPHRLQFLKGVISKSYLSLVANAPLENCCPGCDALLEEPADESAPVEFRQSAPISESLIMENVVREPTVDELPESITELPRTPSLGFFRLNAPSQKQGEILRQKEMPRIQPNQQVLSINRSAGLIPNTKDTPFGNGYSTGTYAGSRMKKQKAGLRKKTPAKRKATSQAKARTNVRKKSTPKKARLKKRK